MPDYPPQTDGAVQPAVAEILVISTSLNKDSRSKILARAAEQSLRKRGVPVRWLDVSDSQLPLCDGDKAYGQPGVDELSRAIRGAAAVLIAAPVYNYDLSAAAKNLIELTGSAWNDKIVGILCAAGGRSSYMSPMAFANSLMLDFRSLIVPRFVYAVRGDFEGGRLVSPQVLARIDELTSRTAELARALAAVHTATPGP